MKRAIVVGVCALAVGLSGCCKKPTESSSSGDIPTTTAQPTTTTTATAAPTAQLTTRTFEMDKPGDLTESYIRIKKVTLSPGSTTLNLTITNPNKRAMSVSTAPPGQITTFYIQSQNHDKRFNLIRSEGLAISPSRQTLKPGMSIDFVLVFAALDPDMTVFDLYEGDKKSQKGGTTYWNFSDVTLR